VGRPLPRARMKEHLMWARECAERAVTLVKDDQRLLPLSPVRHRRVLLIQPPVRNYIRGRLPELQIQRLLTAAGFSVERYIPDTDVHRDHYDVVVYAVAEEGAPLKSALHLRWEELHGDWARAMERHWHAVPTVFISMGTPWHLREVPTCPTYINAYSPVPAVQEAIVKALLGEIPFRGISPVDLKPLLSEQEES
jgi:beta-N-acetylhexosaminidase